jgi:hypothetical protein
MTYRPQSTDKWYNMAGIVAAYQPVSAPDHLAARQNMGQGKLGKYTATLGVAPGWSPVIGWQGGGGAYLDTGFLPTPTTSIVVRFAGATVDGALAGSEGNGGFLWLLQPWSGACYYAQGGYVGRTSYTAGVMGVTPTAQYKNGLAHTGIGSFVGLTMTNARTIYLLADNNGTASYKSTAIIASVLIIDRAATAVEMWQASRQMAYCDTNPEWNVWARQRNYWFVAPSVAYGKPLHAMYYARMRNAS